jgi:hypothetical protein
MQRRELDTLVAALGTMPEQLARVVALAGEADARKAPADGAFSLVEHVWHLAEIESLAYSVRLRRLREEIEPVLSDFDGLRLAREGNYSERSLAEGLSVFARWRAGNLETLAGIQGHEWSRAGTQDLIGPVRLEDVPRMMAEHDATHRAELEDLLSALRTRPGESPGAMGRLLEELAATIQELPGIMRGFTDAALRRAPSTAAVGVERFSAIGHLCHLRDVEVEGYHERIRRLRSESHPLLESLSGERLATERHYDGADPQRALAAFVAAREHSLAVLRSVEAWEWGRVGAFEGYGEVTLLRLVEIMAEHDAGHLLALRELPRT